jgi:hypothetical protein
VSISIGSTLKGTPPSLITIDGGTSNGQTVRAFHAPDIHVGQTYLAFFIPSVSAETEMENAVQVLDGTITLAGNSISLDDAKNLLTSGAQ